ncbi:putative exported protein [Bordetella bronchiseptica Bbr77]|nr:putative exported protein [Bordetella bronchiseptica Bbr77]
MSKILGVVRHILVWWVPGVAMLAALACGFVFWTVASQNGTRLLLDTVARQLDGEIAGVRGSVLRGLQVDRIRLSVADVDVAVDDLRLDVEWRALGQRLLHVRELAATRVEVGLHTPATPPPDSDEPFALRLPVELALDRLSLGEFVLRQDGEPLPVSAGELQASLAAGRHGARLTLDSLRVTHAVGTLRAQGRLDVASLAQPWPLTASLDLQAQGSGPESPLCLAPLLDAKDKTAKDKAAKDKGKDKDNAGEKPGEPADPCGLALQVQAQGTLEQLEAELTGAGQGLALDARAGLLPQAPFPLRTASLKLTRDDQSSLAATLDWQPQPGQPGRDRVVATFEAERLDLQRLAGEAIPPAMLSARGGLDAEVDDLSRLHRATLTLDVTKGSSWNRHPLAGKVAASVSALGDPPGAFATAAPAQPHALPGGLRVDQLDVDLQLGPNRVRAQGKLDERAGALKLDAQAPRLDAFWPGIPGAASVKAALDGALARHRGRIEAAYTPADARARVLGRARAQAQLEFSGGWGAGPAAEGAAAGWRGSVSRLTADSAGFALALERPVTLAYVPEAVAPQWQWQVGATTPTGGQASRLDARLDMATARMGAINGTASATLGGLALDPRQPIRVALDADVTDLAWLGLFVGDTLEVGGMLKANVRAQGSLDGKWNASGTVNGDKLRVVRIDDGVRLIDGTLRARLQDDRVILDSLRFPASLRVMPAEWRTREWVSTNPDAKGGYLEATGQWELSAARGQVRLQLHRFPALQRSDRYGMVSGVVTLDAALPRISINGDITADAGWVSLEILQGVPTLDDDVKVVRAGQKNAQGDGPPLQIDMNLKVDMGPRFYITGMGLDAGLLGSIQIRLQEGRLTGYGALRTRGGGIEAYGQKLRLRRGTLTFQGRLDNPLLDIEALRTGEQVEAGVRVAGTAQRPRIDLVSYPDVSDVEKLSWLVLGRGPDASGGDTALLLSVGTALLGGGQPFYKQFGLDDVSVRSGAIGSSGSLLPDRTVAAGVNRDSDADLATQFLVASKRFANGITLSVEQALAGSETVGRASYRLARGLSLDLKAGSVNGIALVYRILLDD